MTDDLRAIHGDTSWFVHDRFGLFIHWGLYALGARGEWLRHNEQVANEDYDAQYFSRFDPDLHDPDAWAAAASGAGMKYFVVTAKHHEGFCLWDTKLTDYKAPNTPAKRDLLRPMVDAFRRRGLRTGLYYSLLDWHHPDFILDPHIGPYRQHPEREQLNRGRDGKKYAAYMRGQVRELLTGYGDIDILWLDFSYPKPAGSGKGQDDWESDELLKLVRSLRPSIVLNDRLDLPYGWDIKTPEQYQPRAGLTVDGMPVIWEACHTFSASWGYHRDEAGYKSTEQLVQMLVDTVSKGGNLLLNVGPTGRGEFDHRALDRLGRIGKWMKRHARCIYGCGAAPADLTPPPDCRYTYHQGTQRLYLHLFAWPFKHVHLDGLAGRVEYAQLLHDASELPLQSRDWTTGKAREVGKDERTLTLELPSEKPPVTVPVIELYLK